MTNFSLKKARKKRRARYLAHRDEELSYQNKYYFIHKLIKSQTEFVINMNSPQEETYRNMISSFRSNELQTLLGTFGRNRAGRKSELKERALELLRTKPVGFNYQAYVSKIVEIYRSMQSNDVPINNDMYRNMVQGQRQIMSMQPQQQRLYQPPQYPQQQIPIATRSSLPQVMPQMQRGIYGNNSAGNNNIQYNYQSAPPPAIMPINQQYGMGAPDQVGYDINAPHLGNNIIASQAVANVTFKKLPFYEVMDELWKPSILSGIERCSLQNYSRGMREAVYKIPMSLKQINYVSLHRDLSNSKNEYVYQAQIRICLLEPGSSEITDFLPLGLHIRVWAKPCPLPPTAPNTRPGTEARRTPRPINCSNVLKLHPRAQNQITFNWVPDGKTYVWGMYLVKKLSSDFLLEKLISKGARSSDETKSNIIKKLADVDPDLATTSYRVSLMCPLGKMRMKMPAKSITCDHLQCFDASIFILMNEKKPTWLCPTCNKACNYDDIQIESYFLDIVTSSNLPDSCKEIEILADGSWKVYVEPEKSKRVDSAAVNSRENTIDSVDLDDSDDGENDPSSRVPTAGGSRNESNPGNATENSEILKSTFVDLTLSDDESEPPKEKEKQENEAQAADATQPATTTVDLKPPTQALVQPQQAVTSSEQGGIIEIDSPSPPPETPSTETSTS